MKRFLQGASTLAFALMVSAASAQTAPPATTPTPLDTDPYSGGKTPTNQPLNQTRTGGDGAAKDAAYPAASPTPQTGTRPASGQTGLDNPNRNRSLNASPPAGPPAPPAAPPAPPKPAR